MIEYLSGKDYSKICLTIIRTCTIVCVNGEIGKTQPKGETDGHHRRTTRHFDEGLALTWILGPKLQPV